MRAMWILLLLPLAASAELISFGLKGGVPLSNAFKIRDPAAYIADRQPYTIGPVVELHLPARVSVEADALYKPLKYRASVSGVESRTSGRSWEFPVFLKYRFSSGLVRPYLGAGLSFRTIGGLKQTLISPLTGGSGSPAELRRTSAVGAALEGGVELKLLFLKIAPEVRYTRWGTTAFRDVLGGFYSNNNQAEFLIGLTF